MARDAIPDGYELPVVFLAAGFVAAVIFYSRWKNGAAVDPDQRRVAVIIGGIAVLLWLVFIVLLLV
ncbi:hypothetical protein ACFVOK_17880 [Streptomyces sp. NPDC057798]|uniref:hypothetical protein n=1 Tax=Streptomyces sp. NPDC057798 TaxID=3346252 RepID=UPI0036866A1F